jgi:hypothetical protein
VSCHTASSLMAALRQVPIRVPQGVGPEFKPQYLGGKAWRGRAAIRERQQENRVFSPVNNLRECQEWTTLHLTHLNL